MSETRKAEERGAFPTDVEDQVLLVSARRCALCVGLDLDLRQKEGQIAHIDSRYDVSLGNAAFLCHEHQAKYDGRSRQSKGYTPGELRVYQDQVRALMADPSARVGGADYRTRAGGVSLDVYDRRIPIYRTTMQFISLMCGLRGSDLQPVLKFAHEVDEALYLFDDTIADYLLQLYRKAVRLRAVRSIIEAPERRTRELVDEEMYALLWFTNQIEVTRRMFAPYLRLGPSTGTGGGAAAAVDTAPPAHEPVTLVEGIKEKA